MIYVNIHIILEYHINFDFMVQFIEYIIELLILFNKITKFFDIILDIEILCDYIINLKVSY